MMNERDTWKISSFVSKNSKLRSQVQVKHSRRVHRKEILNDYLLQYSSCEQTFHKYRSTQIWKTSFLQVFKYFGAFLFIDKLGSLCFSSVCPLSGIHSKISCSNHVIRLYEDWNPQFYKCISCFKCLSSAFEHGASTYQEVFINLHPSCSEFGDSSRISSRDWFINRWRNPADRKLSRSTKKKDSLYNSYLIHPVYQNGNS